MRREKKYKVFVVKVKLIFGGVDNEFELKSVRVNIKQKQLMRLKFKVY